MGFLIEWGTWAGMPVEAARGANVGRMWVTRKRPIAGTLVNQVGVWLLVYHTGAHLNGTIQRGAELYQDQTVSTAVLGVERLQNQVG